MRKYILTPLSLMSLLSGVSARSISVEEAINRAENLDPTWEEVAKTDEKRMLELKIKSAKLQAQKLYGDEYGFRGATDRVIQLDTGQEFLYLNIAGDGDCCFHATKWPRDTAVKALSAYIEEGELALGSTGLTIAKIQEAKEIKERVISIWEGPIESISKESVRVGRKNFFSTDGALKKYEGVKKKIETIIPYLSSDTAINAQLKQHATETFQFIETQREQANIAWTEIEERLRALKSALSEQKNEKLKGSSKRVLEPKSREIAYNDVINRLSDLVTVVTVDGLFRSGGILEKNAAGDFEKQLSVSKWIEANAEISGTEKASVNQTIADALTFTEAEKARTEPNWEEITKRLIKAQDAIRGLKDKFVTKKIEDYVQYLESFMGVLKDSVSLSQSFWSSVTAFMSETENKSEPDTMLMGWDGVIAISDISPYLTDLNKALKAAKQSELKGQKLKRFNFYLNFFKASAEEKKTLINTFYGFKGDREWMDLGPIAHVAPRFGLKYKVYRQEDGKYKMVQASINADEDDGLELRHVFHTGGHYDMLIPLDPGKAN